MESQEIRLRTDEIPSMMPAEDSVLTSKYCASHRSYQARPESARICRPTNPDDKLIPRRPQTARERGPPIGLGARKLYASRPLSAVPVVPPPPGVAPRVVEKQWPDFQKSESINGDIKKQKTKGAEHGDGVDSNSKTEAPSVEREITPVHWPTLEGPTPLAVGEKRSSVRPVSAPSSARSQSKPGKYHLLYPAYPHQLRPNVRPLSARLTTPGDIVIHQSPTPQSKLTHLVGSLTARERAPTISQKTEQHPLRQTNRKHVPDQLTVLHVASSLPFACDGRLLLDPQLKQVLQVHAPILLAVLN